MVTFRLDLLLLFWSHTKVDITYSVAELKKFIYETGRTYGILQYDKKPALKALVTDVCKRIREAWVFEQHLRTGSKTHESTGKIHQTLFEQSRTLRLQLQETDFALRLTRTIASFRGLWNIHSSYWIVFMTHEDGHTSYFRRWKRNYQGTTVWIWRNRFVSHARKNSRNEDGHCLAYTGIWLGKDTEADESIVHCEGTVYKVRAVRRVISLQARWNTALHKLLNSTPWNPKGKDTTDTEFCTCRLQWLASGRVRPPPGLEIPEEPTEEMKTEEKMADEDDKESLRSLERQDTDVRFPEMERVRSPKRSTEDDSDDEDTREHKRQTVALISEMSKIHNWRHLYYHCQWRLFQYLEMKTPKKSLKNWNLSNLTWTTSKTKVHWARSHWRNSKLRWSQWRASMSMMKFQLNTVLKKTSTMHWMVLGSNEERLPLK